MSNDLILIENMNGSKEDMLSKIVLIHKEITHYSSQLIFTLSSS